MYTQEFKAEYAVLKCWKPYLSDENKENAMHNRVAYFFLTRVILIHLQIAYSTYL